jgi:hypothetical protein
LESVPGGEPAYTSQPDSRLVAAGTPLLGAGVSMVVRIPRIVHGIQMNL